MTTRLRRRLLPPIPCRHRRHARPRPLLPVAHRHPARRPDPHRPVQLGLRPAHRRHVRVPHRGHGRGARQRGELPAAAGRAEVAGHRLGRGRRGRRPARAVPPVAARRPVPGRRRQAASTPATSTSPTPRRRRSRRATAPPAATRSSATTTSTATSPTSSWRRSGPRAASPCCACGCRTRTSPSPTWSAARSRSRPARVPDFVIVRANGAPLYTLVNPVDDALMGITHVLRGEDLLSSTPRQIALYRALHATSASPATCPVRPPAVRHGRGQQEALQARPASRTCSCTATAASSPRGC